MPFLLAQEEITWLPSFRGARRANPEAPCERSSSRNHQSGYGDGEDAAPRFRVWSFGPSRNDETKQTPDQIDSLISQTALRSPMLTIFWRCSCGRFSFRNIWRAARQRPLGGADRVFGAQEGSGNADVRPIRGDFGGRGFCRRCLRDFGCVAARPASRRAPSYLPLRAGRAMRAWALRGFTRSPDTSSAQARCITGASA